MKQLISYPQKHEEGRKDLLKLKINNHQQKVIPANLGNDTARALEWMVEGISKSLEQQPPQILQNNQKNKLIEGKNKKEENEQEVEEEYEDGGGEVDEDKVKNRRRPLLHSGELEELAAAQKLKQLQIDQSKERILQQQNQQKQKTQSTTIEKQLTKLKAEMHAMEAQPNREKTTKLPATPKIVLPIKVENNKNHKHLNNPRPVPILIGDQKIIVSSAAIPQISSKKPSLPLNNSFLRIIGGSIWLDGSIPRVVSTAKWSDWNDWGECFCGKQMRSRTCIYEDNSFQSQGKNLILFPSIKATPKKIKSRCSGKSYESRSCISTTEQCPTTIPPIPPSKQLQLISKKEKPSLNILRRTSLSIGPSTNEGAFKKGNEGQNHQRLSENEILRHRHRLFLAQRHRMMRYKN
uniref:Uncharacterized protein n=1 Tax=Meloidogyne floridensis TaxID=298350 RepID=A0A915PER3_9BILA